MPGRSRWSLRNIYLYLVCLITLIMVIVAVVGLVRSAVGLLYPDPYSEYAEPYVYDKDSGMTEEQIAEQQRVQAESQRRWEVLDLVGNVAMLLVAGPLYVYHWRKIETEATESSPAVPEAPAPPAA